MSYLTSDYLEGMLEDETKMMEGIKQISSGKYQLYFRQHPYMLFLNFRSKYVIHGMVFLFYLPCRYCK